VAGGWRRQAGEEGGKKERRKKGEVEKRVSKDWIRECRRRFDEIEFR
jgi:hypothetical protein